MDTPINITSLAQVTVLVEQNFTILLYLHCTCSYDKPIVIHVALLSVLFFDINFLCSKYFVKMKNTREIVIKTFEV